MLRANEFPTLYHAHHSQELEDLPFWLQLARDYGSPILELGCGSGRVLLPLMQAGFPAVGLDKDPTMLRFIHDTATQSADIVQADLTQFHFDVRFQLILIPCNTYSTLYPDERRSALGCIARHLEPGGAIAVSMPNPQHLLRLRRCSEPELETVFYHPQTGNPVQVSSAWERDTHQFILSWHYDHLFPDGQVERTTVKTCHLITPVQVYLDELTEAGFGPKMVLGGFNNEPFDQHSPHLILISTR
jgi:SAM-dependent methyltransferase